MEVNGLMRALMIAAWALLLSGCSTLAYYAHSAQGQWRLMSEREPIEAILADPTRDAALKQQLTLARAIRAFASRALSLPDNGSYRSYVGLNRPAVVWTVFAAPQFSLEPHQWCFPIAGCVAYRGYFSEAEAQTFAKALETRGLETYIHGVDAYSTLGWFDDPILSSMFRRGETRLASIIFHELAHQQVYLPGDSAFNESFAVTVERAGLRRWLASRGDEHARRRYEQRLAGHARSLVLIGALQDALKALYAGSGDEAYKRQAKAGIITGFQAAYAALAAEDEALSDFADWFAGPINNAKLASVRLYHQYVPAFERLLERCEGDLAIFYQAVEALSRLDASAREQALAHDTLACARLKTGPDPAGCAAPREAGHAGENARDNRAGSVRPGNRGRRFPGR